MKLSDAMRLGSMLRPQGYKHIFKNGRTCAFGAAAEAIGLLDTTCDNRWADDRQIPKSWAWVLIAHLSCPAGCIGYKYHAAIIIEHLNDHHQWTREAIADFVATIEPAESPVVVPDPVPVTASALRGEG